MMFPTSAAPHVVGPNRVARVMRLVIYALAPTVLAHIAFFGPGLLVQIALAVATALLAEAAALKARGKPLEPFLKDGSAVVTALLLALCLPPLAPWWLIVSGVAFAILLAKHAYGGLGANPFNPAMAGYAVLLVSFPAQLLQWLPPNAAGLERIELTLPQTLSTIFTGALPAHLTWDAITSPTPLEALRTNLTMGMTMSEAQSSPVFAALGGKGWQWINLAALAGGVWLLRMRIIGWRIPVAMLGTLAACASIMHLLDPGAYVGPLFHLTCGASMLGAFFIATDPVSAATGNQGKLVYAAGIGLLTYVIRTWGGYADGVAFAVLLMNMLAPLIDRYTIPRIYGHAD
ncbi:MAG TPA: electron transport complex subunit RsxD [Steroidobacter sp.]|jgi:electron transport complex protein RnfD|nr:electron transport complex subunit RsxD [Steroidobacter sp.]